MFFFGCPFAWFAKTQKSVSLSTAEAEYFGAMLAAKEAIFAREELIDLCFAPNGPTTIFSDSKSAVDMALFRPSGVQEHETHPARGSIPP